MVIDASAILAILQQEPEAPALARAIEADQDRLISAVSVLEAGMLAEARKEHAGAVELDHLMVRMQASVVAFDAEQAKIARLAFRRFGKGRHPAGLNFGDCAVYALSKARGERLLFKGDAFSKTDVEVALPAV